MARQVPAFNQESRPSLGLDFPNWIPGKKFANAQHVRVFGTAAALSLFLAHSQTTQLLAQGGLSHIAALPVPATFHFATLVIDADLPGSPGDADADYVLDTGASRYRMQKRIVDVRPTLEFSQSGACLVGGLPQF